MLSTGCKGCVAQVDAWCPGLQGEAGGVGGRVGESSSGAGGEEEGREEEAEEGGNHPEGD